MKQKRAFYLKALGLVAAALIAVLDIMFVFGHKADFSESENRALAGFPSLSLSSITSGRASRQWDDYISDHFPLRSAFVSLNGFKDRLMGSRESNNIIRAADGYLIRRFTEPDEANYASTISAIADFTRNNPGINHTMLLAPTAVTVYADKLPYGAAGSEESRFIDRALNDLSAAGVTCVDVRGALSAAEGQLYYRTDHHWTTDAALIAYREYALARGLSDMWYGGRRLVVSTDFGGTLNANSYQRINDTDALAVYLPGDGSDTQYSVTYAQEGRRASSVYETDALGRRNKYEVFFGGNHARIDIETASTSNRTLLVLKDSYANCFIPFLIGEYSRIIVIDPRYYTGHVSDIIAIEDITDVLYLCNASTFAEDRSLKTDIS